ncbi:MAG TPA: amino acid permease [Bacteroidales bacterium]|nr:amino acid permease [Bacteroidales bacterium]HPS17229.1 amino acid permease [Bacteroidales bacterium]
MENQSDKPGLSRKLGLFTALMVVVCSMIGSGIFKKISPMAASLYSSELIIFCWFLAGVITLLGAISYSGLSRINSEAGGEYQYLKIIFGKFFSFLYGWTAFTVIQSASIASIAYVFGQSVNNIFALPEFNASIANISVLGIMPFSNFGVKGITILSIIIITVINYFGVQYGGWTVNFFTIAKIIGILFLLGICFGSGAGSSENFHQPSQHYGSIGNLNFWGLTSIVFAAMLSAFWAFDGWVNITFLAGEVKNPKRDLPVAIIGGVLIVTVFYMIVNYAYLYVMPVDGYVELAKGQNTIAAAEITKNIIGPSGFIIISVLILISTFGTTNSSVLASSRIYYAMAREGLFFKSVAEVHKKYRTPHRSLIFQCVWACTLVISGTFDQLTDMLIFAAFIFYGSGAFGLFILKKKMKYSEKIFGYPVVPALFIIFCLVLVVSSFVERPAESFIGIGLILTGIPFYLYWKNKKS